MKDDFFRRIVYNYQYSLAVLAPDGCNQLSLRLSDRPLLDVHPPHELQVPLCASVDLLEIPLGGCIDWPRLDHWEIYSFFSLPRQTPQTFLLEVWIGVWSLVCLLMKSRGFIRRLSDNCLMMLTFLRKLCVSLHWFFITLMKGVFLFWRALIFLEILIWPWNWFVFIFGRKLKYFWGHLIIVSLLGCSCSRDHLILAILSDIGFFALIYQSLFHNVLPIVRKPSLKRFGSSRNLNRHSFPLVVHHLGLFVQNILYRLIRGICSIIHKSVFLSLIAILKESVDRPKHKDNLQERAKKVPSRNCKYNFD